MIDAQEPAIRCPRCGGISTSTIAISGMSYSGCAKCRLPVKYYGAYRKEYKTTADCPFCDGMGELNYAQSKEDPYRWGPCLYCREDEYHAWLSRSD